MGYYLTVPVHDLFFMNFPKPILLSKLHHLILSSSLCWSIHLWCTYYFRYYLFVLFVSFYPRHTSFLHLVSKFFFLFLDFIYLFLEREKKTLMWERNIDPLPLGHSPTRDQTHNPGMCPDRESNQQLFPWWHNAQPTELHLSGLDLFLNTHTQIITDSQENTPFK